MVKFNLTIGKETKFLVIPCGYKFEYPRVYVFENEQHYEDSLSEDRFYKGLYIDTALNIHCTTSFLHVGSLEHLGWTVDTYDYLEKLASVIRGNVNVLGVMNRKKISKKTQDSIKDYIDSVQSWVNVQFRKERPED